MKAIDLEKLLPADIPPGERILWHGRPRWISLARRGFGVDLVGAYFGALTIVNVVWSAIDAGVWEAAVSAAKTIGAGALAIGLLGLLAWLSSRTSLYVVTSKRVIMKIGIALPIFFNLPFSSIESAAVRVFSDETGDIPLKPAGGQRIAYLHLWPHARGFRLTHPEPALRSVGRAAEVAEIVSRALIAACNDEAARGAAAPQAASGRPQTSRAVYPQSAVAPA